MAPKLSLIIPCFNCSRTICNILDQLKVEPFSEWECICVDNSPNNETLDVLLKYQEKDPRIVVKRAFRIASAASARNLGLEIASGDFVWIIDSDDEFAFTKDWTLQDFMRKVEEKSSDIMFFPCEVKKNGKHIDSYLSRLERSDKIGKTFDFSSMTIFSGFLSIMPMPPWCKIYKGSFLKSHPHIRFQDVPFCNDNLFSLQTYNECSTVSFLNVPRTYCQMKRALSTSSVENRSNNLKCLDELLSKTLTLNFRSRNFKNLVVLNRLTTLEAILRGVTCYRECTEDEIAMEVSPYIFKHIFKYSNSVKKHFPILSKVISINESKEQIKEIVHDEAHSQPKVAPCKSFSFFDNNASHDAIFILGDGSIYKDLELLLAVHSLRKFCKFVQNVFVVGSKPRCDLSGCGVKFISCDDPYKDGNKDANIMFKIKAAIDKIPDLSENFLLCSDDQLVTCECTWNDFKPKYIKKMSLDNLPQVTSKGWTYRLVKALKEALNKRNEAWFYEPHIWSPINKTTFIEMYKKIKTPSDFKIVFTQYYNSIDCLDHEKIHDHEFYFECKSDWSEEFKNPPKFIAYNDKAFECSQFRQQLALLLK